MFVVSVSDLFSLPVSLDVHNQPLDCLFTVVVIRNTFAIGRDENFYVSIHEWINENGLDGKKRLKIHANTRSARFAMR